MEKLSNELVDNIVSSLPTVVVDCLKAYKNACVLAGGYIRAFINNETPKDIDLFFSSASYMSNAKHRMVQTILSYNIGVKNPRNLFDVKSTEYTETINSAYLFCPVQLIKHKFFTSVDALLNKFDFNICQAAIWWDGNAWDSITTDDYVTYVKEKSMIYNFAADITSIGHSLLRLLNFYKLGYTLKTGFDDIILTMVKHATIPVLENLINNYDKCKDKEDLDINSTYTSLDYNIDNIHRNISELFLPFYNEEDSQTGMNYE